MTTCCTPTPHTTRYFDIADNGRGAAGRLVLAGLALTLLCTAVLTPARAETTDTGVSTQKKGPVYIVPIHGPIRKSSLYAVRRAFRQIRHQSPQPAAVILHLKTPGGSVKQTKEIIERIRALDPPVYSYVHPDALSAGAIIALATPRIYMSPGSTIGSAQPILGGPGGPRALPEDIEEKMMSAMRALARSLAQENGHPEDVAVAMVDRSHKVKIGDEVICPAGTLLNLTAKESIRIYPPREAPLLAEAIVNTEEALLRELGLDDHEVVQVKSKPAEKLAQYLTMVAPLLIGLGLLGIYGEITSPGFGVPGIAGISCLAVALFGHYVAGLAGLEDIALVVVGIGLLLAEVFVIPGFGVAGVLGILSLLGGIFLGAMPHLPDAPPLKDGDGFSVANMHLQNAAITVIIVFLVTVFGAWLMMRLLPRTKLFNGTIILDQSLEPGGGYTPEQRQEQEQLVGKTGVATSNLRPAGIVEIDDRRYDVVTSGDLIEKGARVTVVRVEGNRIVVEAADQQK